VKQVILKYEINKPMKFLICGAGSIGERHIRNLLAIGEKDINILRRRVQPLRTVDQQFSTFINLQEAIDSKPDAAFITNPTSLHIPLALRLAEAGIHLFIEKPLSDSLQDVKALDTITKRKKLIIQMGFMMRYHPAILQIKKWIDDGIIGSPLSARVMWGEYLPQWHPWEDYKKGYSARKDLGGGPIFTLSHDIDLLTWFFGEVKNTFSLKAKKSSLNIPAEDNVEILLEYKNGFIAESHLDYIELPAKRVWDILGDNGRIEFNYYENILTLYKKKKDKYKEEGVNYENFDRNDMFILELKDFLKNIKEGITPNANLKNGVENLKILLAIQKSIKEKRVISLKELDV